MTIPRRVIKEGTADHAHGRHRIEEEEIDASYGLEVSIMYISFVGRKPYRRAYDFKTLPGVEGHSEARERYAAPGHASGWLLPVSAWLPGC
jgi:hypothetical protein